MKAKRKRKQPSVKGGALLQGLKAALFACALTIIVILLTALLLKWQLFGEGAIPVITGVIKALCAAFAGFMGSKSLEGKVWVWSGIAGILYVVISFIVFSLIEKTSAITLGLAADVLMGFIAGVAGGMLRQLKKA